MATVPSTVNELSAEDFRYLFHDDASKKSSSSDVGELHSLKDVYALYGLSLDDRTHRRDQVKMWNRVRVLLDGEIASLTEKGEYDKAKGVFVDKQRIRADFERLQVKAVEEEQEKQRKEFETASSLLRRRLEREDASRLERQERSFETRRGQLRRQQSIERENAAYFNASIDVPPKERWSKRVLELRQAEAGLVKLDLFDDARTVRRMLDKTIKPEQRKNKQLEKQRIVRKDLLLQESHRAQSKRLHEQLSEHKWRALRRSQRLRATHEQRMKNLEFDMTHANVLAKQAKPELVEKPSHHLLQRKHHHQTCASKNGTRLKDGALGKKEETAVFVASLCVEHKFDELLPGTKLYTAGFSS